MEQQRGRPRITTRFDDRIAEAERTFGIHPRRQDSVDYRIAKICNHFVTRAPRDRQPRGV